MFILSFTAFWFRFLYEAVIPIACNLRAPEWLHNFQVLRPLAFPLLLDHPLSHLTTTA